MKKLLRADLSRLFKSKEFLICAALTLAVSVGNVLWILSIAENFSGDTRFYLDNFVFVPVPYTAVIPAVFISLFLGTEYSDRTIRNKLIIGHTRTNIYLADLITCFAGSAVTLAVWFAGMIPGVFFTDGFEIGTLGVLKYFCIALGFTAVFCSLFVLIGMLSPSRTLAAVFVIAAWGALMIAGGIVVDKLSNVDAAELFTVVDGRETITEAGRNRLMTYRTFSRILPTGQAMIMAMVGYGHFSLDLGKMFTSSLLDIAFSLVMTIIITTVGILFFRKKEFK